MKLLGTEIAPLGMGCWPIGGAMFNGDQSLGYGGSDDAESIRTIHAALDAGIRLFDTAAAYGAGHAERLLGQSLRGRDDALIVTKIGISIDETTKQVSEQNADPGQVIPAIERCLERLQRDCVDIVLLHPNTMPISEALPIFDKMETARQDGKIRGYGWSTDFTANVKALDGRQGVVAIEHAMNVFFEAAAMRETLARRDLAAFVRSPLAMGLLTGKYDATSRIPADDVRGTGQAWIAYYSDGRPNPDFLHRLELVQELLQTNGRSLAQGAISWIWAKSDRSIPLPGARTVSQIEDTAMALEHGALPQSVMTEIERLIDRDPEGAERER